MTSLIALWLLSLALCGVGAIALMLLIVTRLLTMRVEQGRDEIRGELLQLILGGSDEVPHLNGTRLRVATSLVCELAEMTRGSDRQAMLDRATRMGVEAHLGKQLLARSAQARLAAVETLALFDNAGPTIRRALDDPNADVRLGAALALARRDDAPPPSVLVEKLRVGTEERSLLLVSMMSDLAQHDPGAVAGLLVDGKVAYDAKVAAIEALSESGSDYAPLLASMAMDPAGQSDLQPRLFRALARTEHPAGREAIMAGLNSEEWHVRLLAARAAGKAGFVEAATRLGEMLGEDNWWIRYRAGEALLRLGTRGLEQLHMAAASGEAPRRDAAIAIMAEGRAA